MSSIQTNLNLEKKYKEEAEKDKGGGEDCDERERGRGGRRTERRKERRTRGREEGIDVTMAVVRVNALFKKKAAAPAKKAKAPAKKKAAAPARKAKKAAPGKGEGNTLFGGLQDMLSTNADTLESRARSGSNANGAQRYGGHDPYVHHGALLFSPCEHTSSNLWTAPLVFGCHTRARIPTRFVPPATDADVPESRTNANDNTIGHHRYIGYRGTGQAGSAPIDRDASGKKSKFGGKVYRFADKYGGKGIDEYAPIFSPEERSSTGDTYAGKFYRV